MNDFFQTKFDHQNFHQSFGLLNVMNRDRMTRRFFPSKFHLNICFENISTVTFLRSRGFKDKENKKSGKQKNCFHFIEWHFLKSISLIIILENCATGSFISP